MKGLKRWKGLKGLGGSGAASWLSQSSVARYSNLGQHLDSHRQGLRCLEFRGDCLLNRRNLNQQASNLRFTNIAREWLTHNIFIAKGVDDVQISRTIKMAFQNAFAKIRFVAR